MATAAQHIFNKPAQGRLAILELLQKGAVTEADVTMLRREAFEERTLSRIEIEDLFALDAVVRPVCEAWAQLLVEAVTDFVIWDQRPTGVLDDAQAKWLIAKVDNAQTASSFAVLIDILDQAHRLPRWFEAAVRSRAVAGWPSLATSVLDRGGLTQAA